MSEMFCLPCFLTFPEKEVKAVTIIKGNAVCEDHISMFMTEQLTEYVELVSEQKYERSEKLRIDKLMGFVA
jgi:hypothetical protein